MSASDPKRTYARYWCPDEAWRDDRVRFSLLLKQKCQRTADYRWAARATSLFVGDENLLLSRIDDEYGQQPSRLRRAGVGAHLMVVPIPDSSGAMSYVNNGRRLVVFESNRLPVKVRRQGETQFAALRP